MTAPILLTGGTGTLGRLVVPRLQAAGQEVRVLSRSPHASGDGVEYVVGDLETGAGVDAAVAGVETIIHAAGAQKGDDATTQRLVDAARRAGADPHLVYISVVGADRMVVEGRLDRAAFGYFASKRAAEKVVEGSGLPWTTLRATQFHDLLLAVLQATSKLPVLPVFAGVRFQPVEADEVAARLVELVHGEASGLVPDLAGPEVRTMKELARGYLDATGKRRLTVPLRLPGKGFRSLRAGANLAPDRAVGKRTWAEFLADRVG